jgi:alpha-beta hydrolase superfamily lysophospholipase
VGPHLSWGPDVLGDGFEATTLPLAPDGEGEVVATVVRHRTAGPSTGAVLYVHGFNDYFFQAHVARWWAERGWDHYAVDLRKYGRSLRPHQTANMCTSLNDYDEDLDAALAVVTGDGHDRVLLAAHSTGGLTGPLWLGRRPAAPVVGVVLNSPFLALKQPPALSAALLPVISAVARSAPTRALPGGVSLYTESIHADYHGEWRFDLDWKPIGGPVRAGWLAAVADGQRRVRAGVGLRVPVLVLASARGVTASKWSDELTTGDAVLDPERIARLAPALGRHVTVARIDGALHDVWLSAPGPRQAAFDTIATWCDAWVAGRRGG